MEKRRLGRTGHMSTIITVGTAALHSRNQQDANYLLDLALQAGINHIDVAPSYGNAETVVGPWLEPHRNKFFLGCKTLERDRNGAWAELHRSLNKLRTDRFDTYQLHAVTTFQELDSAFASGGAIEALQEAREKGLTRFLGITGHGLDAPAIQFEALQRFDFDTVMLPLNPVLYANSKYRQDMQRLLQLCSQRDVGVQIIKSVAKGPWGDREKRYDTWYEPYDIQERITQGVRFALSQAPVATIPGAGDIRLFHMVIKSAESFTPMDATEQEALIAEAHTLEPLFT
jgi:predicted aldo/keto reductase-like oxidoreductase